VDTDGNRRRMELVRDLCINAPREGARPWIPLLLSGPSGACARSDGGGEEGVVGGRAGSFEQLGF
jgi:hypothetical protein